MSSALDDILAPGRLGGGFEDEEEGNGDNSEELKDAIDTFKPFF